MIPELTYSYKGLGDLIKEYHILLHNVPLDIESMQRWAKDEKTLREDINLFGKVVLEGIK